jgi:hypothetical protein
LCGGVGDCGRQQRNWNCAQDESCETCHGELPLPGFE